MLLTLICSSAVTHSFSYPSSAPSKLCTFHLHGDVSQYGTGAFMLLNTGHRPVFSTHGLITTIYYKLGRDFPTLYALEGSAGCCTCIAI